MNVDQAFQAIDVKLDEIDELVMSLPIRAGHKRIIQNKIYELFAEIESAVELSAVDFD